MSFKVVLLASILAYVKAGFLGAPPAVALQAAPAFAYSAAPASAQISYSSPMISYATQLATPTITSESANIHNYGSLGQISTHSKTIDTPFSSVKKSDFRVHNNGVRITAAAAPLAFASPAAQVTTYHAETPAIAAPLGTHALVGPPAVGVAYSAAPAVSHVTFQGVTSYAF